SAAPGATESHAEETAKEVSDSVETEHTVRQSSGGLIVHSELVDVHDADDANAPLRHADVNAPGAPRLSMTTLSFCAGTLPQNTWLARPFASFHVALELARKRTLRPDSPEHVCALAVATSSAKPKYAALRERMVTVEPPAETRLKDALAGAACAVARETMV